MAVAALAAAAGTATAAVQHCCRGAQLRPDALEKLVQRALAGVGRRQKLEHLGCPKTSLRPQATCRRKLRLGEELGQETPSMRTRRSQTSSVLTYLILPDKLPYIWRKTFELL